MHICGVTILRALLFLSNQIDIDMRGAVLHAFYQVTIFTQNVKAHHLRNKSPLRSREIVAKVSGERGNEVTLC